MQHFGGGHGNPLQYSCLEKSTGRGAWWAALTGLRYKVGTSRPFWITKWLNVSPHEGNHQREGRSRVTSLRNRVGTEKEMLSKQASTHWHPEEGTSRNCSQPTARAKSSASDTGRGEGSWSFSSAQFSCSVVSDSLPPHGSQEARLPCPSPTPRACSNSSIELVMPSNYLILCHPLLLLPSIFPNIRVFSNESILCIMWPKYWSFSISSFNILSCLTVVLSFCIFSLLWLKSFFD